MKLTLHCFCIFLSAARASGATIADSIDDWSATGTQGERGWTNGYFNRTADADGAYQLFDLVPFTSSGGPISPDGNHWDGSTWRLAGDPGATGGPWTLLAQEATHPNGPNSTPGEEHWTIRRWTMDRTAAVAITWRLRKVNPFGTGVTGRLFVNGVEVDAATIAGGDTTGVTRTHHASLAAGDVIDLALDPRGAGGDRTDGADGSANRLTIDTDAPLPATNRFIVADSQADWSLGGVQGEKSWQYGYYDQRADLAGGGIPGGGDPGYSVADFIPFTSSAGPGGGPVSPDGNQWDGGKWDLEDNGRTGNGPWTEVTPDGGHPAANGQGDPSVHWAMRRWVSRVSGEVEVSGALSTPSADSDGTVGRIFLNGMQVYSSRSHVDPLSYSLALFLNPGDVLDFAIDADGAGVLDPLNPATLDAISDGSDSTTFTARIEIVEPFPNDRIRIFVDAEGTLHIHLTEGDDSIAIGLSGTAPVLLAIDDLKNDPGPDFLVDLAAFERISVMGWGGDDEIVLDPANGAITDRKSVQVDGGSGQNVIVGHTYGLPVSQLIAIVRRSIDRDAVLRDLEAESRKLLGTADTLQNQAQTNLAGAGQAFAAQSSARLEAMASTCILDAESLISSAEACVDRATADLLEGGADALELQIECFSSLAEQMQDNEMMVEFFGALMDEAAEHYEAKAEALEALLETKLEAKGEAFELAAESSAAEGEDVANEGEKVIVPMGEAFLAQAETQLAAPTESYLEGMEATLDAQLSQIEAILDGGGGGGQPAEGDEPDGGGALLFSACPPITTSTFFVGTGIIIGTPANDVLVGIGPVLMFGGKGDDAMFGILGPNLMAGNRGQDKLVSFSGLSLMLGGRGSDCMRAVAGLDFMFGGREHDSMEAAGALNVLAGGKGFDNQMALLGLSLLFGGEEPDTMKGGPFFNLMLGGNEDDTMTAGRIAINVMFGGCGDDFMYGDFSVLDLMFGQKGRDRMDGGDLIDVMFGGEDDDVMDGGPGIFDLLFGNQCNDTMDGGRGVDLVFGNTGDDVVRGGDDPDLLFGNRGDDHVDGGAGLDLAFGNSGADEVHGGGGLDLVFGNSGNDVLFGEAGLDLLFGNRGGDALSGGPDPDLLFGNRGNDWLHGDDGVDLLFGNRGDDHLDGGSHTDLVFGGRGDDKLHGGPAVDLLFGSRGADRLFGDGETDLLFGSRGDDKLWGGPGVDLIFASRGADVVFGEDSRDVIFGGRDGDVVYGGLGKDIIFGGRHDDTLSGDDERDLIFSGRDDDLIDGGGGDDILFGNRGKDEILGGPGKDRMFGGLNDDQLCGGPDNDTLLGGLGSNCKDEDCPTSCCTHCSGGLPQPACGEIHGLKWHDLDADGTIDSGEPFLPGVTIYIDQDASGTFTSGDPSTVTLSDDPTTHDDETGSYWFMGLAPGQYRVREVVPASFVLTAPPAGEHVINLGPGQIATGMSFGDARNCRPVKDGDVWSCTSTQCPPGLKCVPIKVRVNLVIFVPPQILECDCRAPEECHLEQNAAGFPICVGSCPGNEPCIETMTEVPGAAGFYDLTCDCPPPPPPCRPNANGSACEEVFCDTPGEKCVPTCVNFDPCTGAIKIIDCDCRGPESCYVDINVTGTQPECIGDCPSGTECSETVTEQCDGTIDICCECSAPPPGCEVCPGPDKECKPACVAVDANGMFVSVLQYRCVEPDECYIDIYQGRPICRGDCEDGFECARVEAPIPNTDLTMVCCECVSEPPECDPLPDGSACAAVACPEGTDHTCRPTCVRVNEVGQVTVASCECLDEEECYIDIVGSSYVVSGKCPEGEVPQAISCPIHGTQDTLICCVCVPADECRTRPDGSACEMVQCPEPGLVCRPTCVRVTRAAKVEVLDCECLPPDSCYLDIQGDAVTCVHGSGCSPGGCKEIRDVDEETGDTIICCACIDKPILCAPTADRLACDDTNCTSPGDPRTCLPTRVAYHLGAFTQPEVLECECLDPMHCHVDLLQSPPDCTGGCPPGKVCKKTETPVPGSNLTEISCECVTAGGVGPFRRGNVDASAVLDLSDGVRIFGYLFLGSADLPCLASADTNGDAKVDISDGVKILGYLFLGTAAPVAPFPGCGVSPSEADARLGCETPDGGCGG